MFHNELMEWFNQELVGYSTEEIQPVTNKGQRGFKMCVEDLANSI
jgi:hypothetical protein